MKRIFYFFVVSCMCFLYSCKDENYTTVIMEGFYNSKKAVQVSSTRMARGECLSAFMTSVARQPDMYEKLDSTAIIFLGTAETLSSMSVLLDYSCYNAIAGYNEALTRQPEIKDTLDIICRKFLGVVLEK